LQKLNWNFDNSYTKLPGFFYSKQLPTPVRDPKLIIFNDSLAEYLGVPLQSEVFAGNEVPEGAGPLAQAYAGHQFGYFTMLGDGRAILLGEQITGLGERFDIQLKGSGRTPYSRRGDGRAALGPMLREYIISEAMYALGIPTTRSLAVVTTGETVMREDILTGAVLTRVASSHIRVGTFEYAFHFGTAEDVRSLADYTIARHFPEAAESENKYRQMLKEVARRQASLISKWQLSGFIHGVMNTDNMAVSGETIDYGPCAFMDAYHPATVFSSIDTHRRYAYGNQPGMAAWNITCLAETLLPLLHDDKTLAINLGQEAVSLYWDMYQNNWLMGMKAKLGLYNNEDGDEMLIKDLLQLMRQSGADYTNTFRSLTLGVNETAALFSSPGFYDWNRRWRERLGRQTESEEAVMALMKSNNPSVIPRNHRVEEVLAAAENDDFTLLDRFLRVLCDPYGYTPEQEEYAEIPSPAFCSYQTFCGT